MNGSNAVAKVAVSVGVGDVLEVSEPVGAQLVAAGLKVVADVPVAPLVDESAVRRGKVK
jgi:hypothetical protein